MAYCAGLDVSVKETRVCIVDDAGKIVREARVASEPEALLQVLTNTIYRLKRVGLLIDGLFERARCRRGALSPAGRCIQCASEVFHYLRNCARERLENLCLSPSRYKGEFVLGQFACCFGVIGLVHSQSPLNRRTAHPVARREHTGSTLLDTFVNPFTDCAQIRIFVMAITVDGFRASRTSQLGNFVALRTDTRDAPPA